MSWGTDDTTEGKRDRRAGNFTAGGRGHCTGGGPADPAVFPPATQAVFGSNPPPMRLAAHTFILAPIHRRDCASLGKSTPLSAVRPAGRPQRDLPKRPGRRPSLRAGAHPPSSRPVIPPPLVPTRPRFTFPRTPGGARFNSRSSRATTRPSAPARCFTTRRLHRSPRPDLVPHPHGRPTLGGLARGQ